MTKRKYSKIRGNNATDEELVVLVQRVDLGYYQTKRAKRKFTFVSERSAGKIGSIYPATCRGSGMSSFLVPKPRACSGGNTRYYEEIVVRYRKKLLPYLRRLIGVSDEAEDLLQNVFIKVFRHLADFDVERKFSPWIYRIAHNEAVNYLKKKSYRRLIAWEDIVNAKESVSMANERETPQEARMRDDARIELRKALNMLPKKYKEILQLRYYLDKSYTEMSQILKKPENTIASTLNRAKKQLFQLLDRHNS